MQGSLNHESVGIPVSLLLPVCACRHAYLLLHLQGASTGPVNLLLISSTVLVACGTATWCGHSTQQHSLLQHHSAPGQR
jgi:hypothetical protein